MNIISFMALILLSLLAYSGGVVGKAAIFSDPKPKIIDLTHVLIIWAAAIYSRAGTTIGADQVMIGTSW